MSAAPERPDAPCPKCGYYHPEGQDCALPIRPPCNCEQSLALMEALATAEVDTLVKVARVLRDDFSHDAGGIFGIIELATGSTRTAAAVLKAIGEEP